VGELRQAASIKAQWSLEMAVRGAEARGCCNCMPAHSILASVGKGKGESRRGGDGLARKWPEEGDWGRLEVGDGPDRWVPPVNERERERRGGPTELGRGREIGAEGLLWLRAKKGKREGDRWAEGEAWAAAEFIERR
jgi:hypothetical protein